MRARLIQSCFWKSESVSDLSFFERLLFMGLWAMADKRGVIKWSAKRTRAELFPYDDVTADQCLTGVKHLSDMGMTILYKDAQGVKYVFITGFGKHQQLTSGEKNHGKLLGPLPKDEGCSVVFGSDNGQTFAPYTDTDTDTDTDADVATPTGSDNGSGIETGSVLVGLWEEFKGVHPECVRVADFVFAEVLRGQGLDWHKEGDLKKIKEAIHAFGRDYSGSSFSGRNTPQKCFRSYVERAAKGPKKSGGGFNGGGGPDSSVGAGGAPREVFGGLT